MTTDRPFLSVIDPLAPAIERMKVVLFRPFDLGRWITIGFCAWLAFLGQGGGGGGGGGSGNYGGGPHQGGDQFRHELHRAWEYIMDNLYWILPLMVGMMVVGCLIWALVTWLSSRGQFMFLHCVTTNRAEIQVPWRDFRSQGNSLFLFRFVVSLIGAVLVVPSIIAGVVMILVMVANNEPAVGLVLGTIAAFLGACFFGIIFSVVGKLTLDFVVPLMVLRSCSWRVAWSELLGLLSAYKAAFLLYILFQIVLAVAVGVLVFAVVIITCCCAGCLLALPFVGTVLLLPVSVFDRAYSLYYLEQFGPDFRLIVEG